MCGMTCYSAMPIFEYHNNFRELDTHTLYKYHSQKIILWVHVDEIIIFFFFFGGGGGGGGVAKWVWFQNGV